MRHEEEVLKTGTDTSEQLRGEQTGIKSELDSGDGKVEVYVRLLWNELPPSSGRIAQHPCHREGHMEVCRQWQLLFETDMSRNEPEGRKSHRGSIFLSICFKFWFTKKHSLFFKIQYYFCYVFAGLPDMCELRVCIMSGWWTGLMYWGWAAIWLTCSTGAEWWRTLTYRGGTNTVTQEKVGGR